MPRQENTTSYSALGFIRALVAPSVPSAVANGGLRWDDLNDPQVAVLVHVRLNPGTVFVNDAIDLYWQNEPVANAVINNDHLTAGIVTLSVFPKDILEHNDGLHSLYYIATAAIGGGTDKSATATVKVKRLVPGGYDNDAGTEYINENLLAPTGIPELIDDDIADLGVTVTIGVYENMAEGDLVKLDWGGQRLGHTPLTAPDVGKPVTFLVGKDVLVAGPGSITVRYEVRDEVNNWSKWSLLAHTDVETGDDLLPAPRIVSAVNGVIDLVTLGDQAAHVQTPVYAGMDLHDQVLLSWQGETAEGVSVPVSQSILVDSSQLGWPLDFYIANEKVRAIAQGHTVVSYAVTPTSGLPSKSRRNRADVVGQVALLAAPLVAGATGGVLDLSTLPATGATVTILANDLIKPGNSILLKWDGVTAGGVQLPYPDAFPVTGSMDGGPIDRLIPLSAITPLENGQVTVSFILTKDGVDLPSQFLVLQIKSQGALLPKPTVDYAVGDTLDPDLVPSTGTTVRVNYSPMQTDDRIDVQWDGVLDYTDYFPVSAGWGNKEVTFPITRRYVDLNKGETVQVFYTVTRNGQELPTSSKQSLLIGTALELPKPSVKEASGNSLDPIAAKDILTVVVPHYAGMMGTDEVSVIWEGNVPYSIGPFPVGTVGAKDIELPNELVGLSLGQSVKVSYTVLSGGTTKESDPLVLAVQKIDDNDPDLAGLVKIEQASNGVLDLGSFTGNATVLIDRWPFMAAGQAVWLRVKGLIGGQPDTIDLWVASVVNEGEVTDGYLKKDVPRDRLEAFDQDTALTVEYKINFNRNKNEVVAVQFPVPAYTVKQAMGSLIKPSVKEASGNSLDPIAAKDTLTVVVPHYAGMMGTDEVSVIWEDSVPYSFGPFPVGTVGAKEIELPTGFVGLSLGQSVKVSYTVLRGGTTKESDPLVLAVQKIDDNDPDMAGLVKIEQASNGVLDLSSFTGNATVLIDGWPFMSAGQPVWLRVKGLVGGQPDTIELWVASVVNEGEVADGYLKKGVPRDRLETFDQDSALTVEYKVNFDQNKNEMVAVQFPVPAYTVKQAMGSLIKPSVQEASGNSLDPIAAKDTLTVVVPHYTGMMGTDEVSVIWEGNIPNSFGPFPVGTVGAKEIELPTELVGLSLGKSVKVSYTVLRGGTTKESDPLVLAVQKIDDNDPDLAGLVKIEQASNGVLDLSSFTGNATVLIDGWPFMAVGQPVWLRVKGLIGGQPETIDLWVASVVNEGEVADGYLRKGVPRDRLETFDQDSALTVEYKVNFDQNKNEMVAVQFPVPAYTVKQAMGSLIKPSVQEASGNSLDPIAAKDTLTVVVPHYTGMMGTDEVSVIWEGNIPNSFGPFPVGTVGAKEIELPTELVGLSLGKSVKVSYTVLRGGTTKESDPLVLAVQKIDDNDPDLAGLVKIEQASNGVLDLSSFTGNATVLIDGWPFMAVGQPVWLRVKGLIGGQPETIDLWVASVVNEGEVADGYLRKGVPRDRLETFDQDSALSVEYKVNFDQEKDEAEAVQFPVPTYTLKLAMGSLIAPYVKEADGSTLNPIAAKDTLTVVVPYYDDMKETDEISVTWNGTTGAGSDITVPIPVGTIGAKEITLATSLVALNLDTSVSIFYRVIRSGSITESCEFPLAVQNIDNTEPEMTGLVKIKETSDGILDLNSFTGNATVRIEKWPFMAAGQMLWLRVHGTNGGQTDVISLWEDSVLTAEEVSDGYLEKAILRNRLEALDKDSEMRVEYKVNFKKEQDEDGAVLFPASAIRITKTLPLFEDFEVAPMSLVLGVPVVLSAVIVTMIQANAYGNASLLQVNQEPPYLKGGVLYAASAATTIPNSLVSVKIELRTPASKVHMGVMWKDSRVDAYNDAGIQFWDADDKVLGMKPAPMDVSDFTREWIEFIAPTDNKIKYVVLWCQGSHVVQSYGVIYIDNITITP